MQFFLMDQKSEWSARISTFILSGWWKMRAGSLYSLVNQPDSITRCLGLAGKDAWINAPPVRRVFRAAHLEPYPRHVEPQEGPWGCPSSRVWCSSPLSLGLAVWLPLVSGVQRAERRRYDQKWGIPSLKMLPHILFRLLLVLLAQSCVAPLEIRRGVLWKNSENSK